MPIGGCFSQEEPAPGLQAEFDTPEAWTGHVKERFLSDLRPGEPFLLIVRKINHAHRQPSSTWMSAEYFVGVLGDEPLVTHDGETCGAHNPQVRIDAQRFVCHPRIFHDKNLADYVEGAVLISQYPFLYTPVTKPFVPPFHLSRTPGLYGQAVDAFSAACGIEAMEALALEESAWNRDFLGWYTRAMQRLGLPLVGGSLQEAKFKGWRGLIRGMREDYALIVRLAVRIDDIHGSVGQVRSEGGAITIVTDDAFARIMSYDSRKKANEARGRIEKSLALADELGLSSSYDLLDIDGFRCQPAIVIEDFRRIFPRSD